ncbi:hypothetical protein BYT27DRAFT_7077462 [Phlegmacium glaucopus]|nr:hypothetical protein BYT27DRAFT_7093161 [Phlegmacium glaucopus]KAF8816254.1 hypothetical protein BYT27DRAFT_7077462 [Phlegmacium glaucopus]
MVQGARSSRVKGSKALYYPSAPPENSTYNPDRPSRYDLYNLPLRTQSQYWKIIKELEDAQTKKDKANIVKATGISRIPLCAASKAFIHPTFFPIDPFHLFYENEVLFIWDLWTTISDKNDPIHFHRVSEFGALIPEAIKTLPPVFCGPVRDPYLKRQSQYKIYEWMALLHWYIIPIGIETGMHPSVLQNFSQFVEIIEFAMTNTKRTDADLSYLQELIIKFLLGFEKLYVGNDPEKINRMRLCIFQLIHVPNHIRWNGSIRLGSQATVERSIGEIGRMIRSKKAPFANLTNLIYEKELIKILCLYYPTLDINRKQKSDLETVLQPIQQHKIYKKYNSMTPVIEKELASISVLLKQTIASRGDIPYSRWGKLKLLNGHVLSSRSTEAKNRAQNPQTSTSIFGEALSFYQIDLGHPCIFVIYKPLVNVKRILNCLEGQWQEGTMLALNANDIISLVGIWAGKNSVWILRKHPGLAMLTPEECGIEDSDGGEGEINEGIGGAI